MNTAPSASQPRGRFDGLLQIVRYNWPQYGVAAAVVVGAGCWLTLNTGGDAVLRSAAWGMVLPAAWWGLASLIASHWIYDRSPLYQWDWIPSVLSVTPKRWLNLHAGLDESSAALDRLFPGSDGQVGDFYVAAEMSEPSIRRAQRERGSAFPSVRVNPLRLPFAGPSFDTVFLLFAAHELRNASSRETFMAEIRRVLLPGGTVLLVEHARDWVNFAAFGPGFLHFQPATEWRRLASVTQLELVTEKRMTPFIRISMLRKPL